MGTHLRFALALTSTTHRDQREEPPSNKPTAGGGEALQAYTVEQVAEMLHVGRDKIYYLLRTGQLRSIKIGKLRRITDQHLAAFIASLEDPEHPAA
jgi:excisionase family DNA binding protein